MKKALMLALSIAAAGCGTGQQQTTMEPADLLTITRELAAGEMQGRAPGSEGDRRAREYLAKRLAAIGCEPTFGDSWHQPFELVGVTARMPETWTFRAGEKQIAFSFADEYMGASGVQRSEVDIENAEVVFVGYGIEAPEENWDDFGDADLWKWIPPAAVSCSVVGRGLAQCLRPTPGGSATTLSVAPRAGASPSCRRNSDRRSSGATTC